MRIVLVTAFFNNVVITTVIEMVEMVEILDGRLGKQSVERVRYVIGRAKRAPHWGVQSRFRVIYICMSVCLVCQINCVGGIT